MAHIIDGNPEQVISHGLAFGQPIPLEVPDAKKSRLPADSVFSCLAFNLRLVPTPPALTPQVAVKAKGWRRPGWNHHFMASCDESGRYGQLAGM